MTDTIEYGSLMHDAMRGLIQKVLEQVAKSGLPADHHFFITFDTSHPDAELADWLSDRYPTEMTVVMQHWYDKLEITNEGFSVTLNFGDQPEPLYIPYDAIKTFVDPSVEFGLRFEAETEDDAADDATSAVTKLDSVPEQAKPKPKPKAKAKVDTPKDDAEPEPAKDADIVSLDSFRK
ncbi:MAG: ClpXP protease specificity-enhancing factor SspB [Aliishimia sp.]